jgi:hypothetical protein
MSREKEQLPELTAFEAALAALTPRVEGFDRERLIFQSGRASVLPRASGSSRRWACWGWPAAFAAMTAVAASLAVMLWSRAAANVAVRGEQQAAAGIADDKVAAVSSAPASPAAAESPADRTLDAVAAWLSQWSAEEPSASRGSQGADPADSLFDPQLCEQFVRRGAGSHPPEAVASAGAAPLAAGPLPYRELLDRLLKQQTSGGPLPRAPGDID